MLKVTWGGFLWALLTVWLLSAVLFWLISQTGWGATIQIDLRSLGASMFAAAVLAGADHFRFPGNALYPGRRNWIGIYCIGVFMWMIGTLIVTRS